MIAVALGGLTALAQGTGGSQQGDLLKQRDRDQLQTCSPTLDQDRTRTRLQDRLADCVQDKLKDMKQTREQYQQQIRDAIKEKKACTEQDRVQLRDQLRTAIKDQIRDREQLRDRLQAIRDSLPSHDQLMEQAREQVQARDRRGE